MSVLGPRALIDRALPSGIDATTVLNWMLKSNISAAAHIANVAAAIGEVNQAIAAKYGGLFYVTEELYAVDAQGAGQREKTPRRAEFGKPDGVRADVIGHMLPIDNYRDALSWTPLYMREASPAKLAADAALIADRFWNRVGSMLWTRILTTTETLIGTGGYDVPWAIGSGTNVNFIPTQVRGWDPLTSSHTHFRYFDSGSYDWADVLKAQQLELRHHGIQGDLSAFVSLSDVDTITGVDGYVEKMPTGWGYYPAYTVGAAATTTNPVRTAPGLVEGMPGEVFGYFKSAYGVVELRWDEYIPQYYDFMCKSTGVMSPGNPLAIRVFPGGGFGLVVNPQLDRSLRPELESVYFDTTLGVGVSNRVGGVCGYLASGAASYVSPTVE